MKRPQKAETAVQREIKKALEAVGYLVRRIHSGKVRVRGGWLQLAENGTPDLLVIGTHWMGLCEVKTKDGELNPEQVEFAAEMERRGVSCFSARNAEDAIEKAGQAASERRKRERPVPGTPPTWGNENIA